MTETTGKTCLPCCCAWMPVPWPLTWRPGRWRARHARPALAPWGYGRERAVRLRGGRTVRLRPRRARCRSCRRTRVLLPSWCAPRRADGIEVIGAAAGLAMAGAGHRPVAAALGVPAATARGRLRRLRGRAEPLRQHAIGELNGLGFYPPGPPSEPAGSPLGDALNAVAAAVDCARRNFGHGPEMTWPLAGRLGLAASSCPPPPAAHLPPVPGTAMPAPGPATLTAASCSPRRDTMTRSAPP